MAGDTGGDRAQTVASLLAVIDDPAAGRRRLPRLLGRLDAADRSVRIGAAWALCAVAASLPDTATYLTRRLVDRIEGPDPSTEAEMVLEYVAAHHPEAVTDALDEIATEAENRPRSWPISGSLARANYHRPEIGNRDVGRTRLPGEGRDGGGRQVYTDDGERHDQRGRRDEGLGDVSEGRSMEDGDEADGTGEADDTDKTDGTGGPGAAGSGESWQPADDLSGLVYGDRFDRLTVLADAECGRYAGVYRALGVLDGEPVPVGVALYHRPAAYRDEFAEAVGEQLARWAAVADHENVVTVHDWGVDPRPWAATEYVGGRLADRDRPPLDEALWNAEQLAAALVHVHESGVVHGGIDPGNVVYSDNEIDETERQPLLLDNVGLLHAVRRHFDPTRRLDPRYAAPEYFDRRFGRIDHATDVYHLGAVVYLLVTGRPPYAGDYERVRDRVLSDPPPRPTDVADVPAAVDDVVTKAMARQKLRRYETVAHAEQDLRGLRAELGVDGDR